MDFLMDVRHPFQELFFTIIHDRFYTIRSLNLKSKPDLPAKKLTGITSSGLPVTIYNIYNVSIIHKRIHL